MVFWAAKTNDGFDGNGLLKTYEFSMEDKMAGAFGCARNYGWDGMNGGWPEFRRALLIRQHTKVRRGPYQGPYMITSWPGTTMKCWHQSLFSEFQLDGCGWQSGVIETKRNYVHTKKTWHGILDSPSVIIVFIFTDEAVPVESLSKDGETPQSGISTTRRSDFNRSTQAKQGTTVYKYNAFIVNLMANPMNYRGHYNFPYLTNPYPHPPRSPGRLWPNGLPSWLKSTHEW